MTSIIVILLATAALAAAAVVALRLRRGGAERPLASAVLVKHPAAGDRLRGGEMVVSFPGQTEGLALNAVAARCWEMMDGARTLAQIGRALAAEYGVSPADGLREARLFARRMKEALLAMEAREWDLVHIHAFDLFEGAARGDPALVERRLAESLVVHAAACLEAPGGAIEPWRGTRGQRRAAAAAMAEHREREAPLEAATREFQAGWDHCTAGRLTEAEGSYRRCLERAPGWANAHYQLGYVLLRQKRYADAARSLVRTEELSPGHYMVREYIDQARRLSEGLLAHEAFVLFDRANASGLRDPDATIRLLSRALEINPEYPSARLVLARAYQKKARYDEALAELGRTIRMDPDKATLCHALYSRGAIFLAQGRTEEAMREWEKVIQIDGSSSATRSAIANMAASAGIH